MAANVGGQAVIEGVMMRSPNAMAVAVRKADGTIAVREGAWQGLWTRFPFLKLPFLRGGVVLLEALHNGISALRWAAEQSMDEEEAEEVSGAAMTGTMIFSIVLAFGLFIALPHALALLLGEVIGAGWMDGQSVPFHFIAGFFKVAVFLTYIYLIGRLADIKRVFQYHGAEHKSIYVYENDEELTVENARKWTRLHPRCGTSFIFIVIIAGIFIFSAAFGFLPPLVDNGILNQFLVIALKLPLLFPIAGLAYEFQRFSARNCEKPWVKPLIWPGLMLQKLTTQEPDDSQLEVALAALKKALWRERVGRSEEAAAERHICTVYGSYLEIPT
jgi:uncharacterized protein YqhQ